MEKELILPDLRLPAVPQPSLAVLMDLYLCPAILLLYRGLPADPPEDLSGRGERNSVGTVLPPIRPSRLNRIRGNAKQQKKRRNGGCFSHHFIVIRRIPS